MISNLLLTSTLYLRRQEIFKEEMLFHVKVKIIFLCTFLHLCKMCVSLAFPKFNPFTLGVLNSAYHFPPSVMNTRYPGRRLTRYFRFFLARTFSLSPLTLLLSPLTLLLSPLTLLLSPLTLLLSPLTLLLSPLTLLLSPLTLLLSPLTLLLSPLTLLLSPLTLRLSRSFSHYSSLSPQSSSHCFSQGFSDLVLKWDVLLGEIDQRAHWIEFEFGESEADSQRWTYVDSQYIELLPGEEVWGGYSGFNLKTGNNFSPLCTAIGIREQSKFDRLAETECNPSV